MGNHNGSNFYSKNKHSFKQRAKICGFAYLRQKKSAVFCMQNPRG